MTPIRGDTSGSFLYRFTPIDKSQKPGALQKGGKLEALKAVKPPTANDADLLDQSTTSSVSRVEDTTKDAHARNCLCFNRLEGAAFAAGTL